METRFFASVFVMNSWIPPSPPPLEYTLNSNRRSQSIKETLEVPQERTKVAWQSIRKHLAGRRGQELLGHHCPGRRLEGDPVHPRCPVSDVDPVLQLHSHLPTSCFPREGGSRKKMGLSWWEKEAEGSSKNNPFQGFLRAVWLCV